MATCSSTCKRMSRLPHIAASATASARPRSSSRRGLPRKMSQRARATSSSSPTRRPHRARPRPRRATASPFAAPGRREPPKSRRSAVAPPRRSPRESQYTCASMSTLEARTRYDPAEVEPRIVRALARLGAVPPRAGGRRAEENYSIAIPPPNVTGALHMGHALNGSIQDALIRYHRMRGQRTKWILGTDHAGIATQKQVEKRAARARARAARRSGARRSSERVWEWREQYGGTIIEQFKRLGASLRLRGRALHARRRATRDAVLKVFVDLYEKGLHLPRPLPGQLGPGQRARRSPTSRSRTARSPTRSTTIAYPLGDGDGDDHGRDRAPRDDARRHRGRRAPRRRALRAPVGADGDPAARRARAADHRRRLRQARLRHRRAEDHARPRPQRLRDRPPPRARRDHA